MQSTKANATYQSPHIQNALIVAAGDLVKETVVSRIKSAKFWAIVADETTDRRCREQLAVIARYVKMDISGTWHCYEEPFAIVDIFALIKDFQPSKDCEHRLSGKTISEALLHIVKRQQLDLTNCIGRGYDGASSFSGQRAVAAARFLVEAPNAHYYHCAMHCLNLSTAKAITVKYINHAQDVIKDTISCLKSSDKRADLLKSCIHDEDDTRISKTQLIPLCTTRFVERHTSVVCLQSLLKYVMAALQRMSDWQSPDARKTAILLMNSTAQPNFVVSLVVLEVLSGLLLPTTRQLQNRVLITFWQWTTSKILSLPCVR